MAELKAVTNYVDNNSFDMHINNHVVRMDTPIESGGNNTGATPKQLLLGTLAGCTGMDVVALLKKMRVDFSDFSIETSADLTTEHPKVFTEVSIVYKIKTAEENKEKVDKAIHLSKERYCGISAMLAKNSPIKFEIVFL